MKKLVVLLMAVVMVLGIGFAYDEGTDNPRIIFDNKTDMPKVDAGENLSIRFKVKNTGGDTAKNISIVADSTDAPISIESAIDTYSIYRMSAGSSRDIELKFKVKETADVGVYVVPFTISYNDYNGTSYTNKQSVYFEVENELAKPLLIIKNVKNYPENIIAGQNNLLSFDLYNMGDLTARRVKLTLTGLKKDGFMVADSIDNRYFEEIDGNISERVEFYLNVSEDIVKGTNELAVKLEYNDQDGKDYSDQKVIYINNVQGENGGSGKGTPKIIISSYNTSPRAVTAGNVVDFAFTFKNTNEAKHIKNMKMVIASEDGIFNIEEGSNSFYVANLAPQEEMTKSIKLRPKQDTLSRAYPVTITFDYEDVEGTSYNTKESINVQVIEKSNLSINNVYGPYEMYQGGSTSISFEYYNKGKAVISNLNVTVEGDYRSVNETNYIGNVEAGKGSFFDIEITTDKSGDLKGKLVFSFEDSSGKILKVEKEISGYVYEDMPVYEDMSNMMDMPMYDMPAEEEGMEWWKLLLIGLGSFIATTIITRLITIKVMMKKIEDEI